MKKGFTLIELLVVVAIVAVLLALIIPIFNGPWSKSTTFNAELTEKWTDLDGSNKIYRVRTKTSDGDVETWDSSVVHNKVHVNQWYKFEASKVYLISVEPLLLENQPQDKN